MLMPRNGGRFCTLRGNFLPGRSPSLARLDHGFTVIELIGVLTVIALLAAAVIPQVIKRIDQAALARETSDLNAIADAYTQYILRNKTIPGTNTWASTVANYMSLPTNVITTTPRGILRAFLVDPNLR